MEMYRVKIQEALEWPLHKGSLAETLRDAAVANRFQEMEVEWEEAGSDFYSAFRLDVRVEGDEFVVVLVDETDGRCPHGQDPALCEACREFADRQGMEPFWMRRRRCSSCGEMVPLDEHTHECIICGRLLCNNCFSASPRCPECTGEPLPRFEVTLLVPTASWVIEAINEQDAMEQVAGKPDYQLIVGTYSGEPYDLRVTELEEEDG